MLEANQIKNSLRANVNARKERNDIYIDIFGTPNPSPSVIRNWMLHHWVDEHHNVITFDEIAPLTPGSTNCKRILKNLEIPDIFVSYNYDKREMYFYHADDMVLFKIYT